MSSSSSWTQQKEDTFKLGLAKILFHLTIMLIGNIIYEPIIYGNANKIIVILGKREPYNKCFSSFLVFPTHTLLL
jgi:hypothetical protein